MTFEEALESKKQFGELHTDKKNDIIDYGVLITPKNENDLELYFSDRYKNAHSFNRVTIIDSDAKKYSSDNEYSIYAIKVMSTLLLKKKLA
tara:strand:+ start:3331 stop:3603 length:273 start_codon:yes stop_codon:yes gene_type:complete